MTSLIVTLISIALAALIAIASAYYGGNIYSAYQARAASAAVVAQAQQIYAAATLYQQENGTWPADTAQLEGRYLTTVPTPPAGAIVAGAGGLSLISSAYAAGPVRWSLNVATRAVVLESAVANDVCRSIVQAHSPVMPADALAEADVASAGLEPVAGRVHLPQGMLGLHSVPLPQRMLDTSHIQCFGPSNNANTFVFMGSQSPVFTSCADEPFASQPAICPAASGAPPEAPTVPTTCALGSSIGPLNLNGQDEWSAAGGGGGEEGGGSGTFWIYSWDLPFDGTPGYYDGAYLTVGGTPIPLGTPDDWGTPAWEIAGPARAVSGPAQVYLYLPDGNVCDGGVINYVDVFLRIDAISPDTGSYLGGNVATITGDGFTPATTVTATCPDWTEVPVAASYVSSTNLDVVVPACGSVGWMDFVVQDNGQSQTVGYSLDLETPLSISSVVPASAAFDATTTATLIGTGFRAGEISVTVYDGKGYSAPAPIIATSGTEVVVEVPPNPNPVATEFAKTTSWGYLQVDDTLGVSANAGFNYQAQKITQLTPNSGDISGGSIVTAAGRHLGGGTVFYLGGSAVAFDSVSPDGASATFTLPPRVSTGTVASSTVRSGVTTTGPSFIYTQLSLSSLTPSYGSYAGGYTVSLNGTSFAAGSVVTFDGSPIAATYVNPGTLQIVVPERLAEMRATPVQVTVTNPNGAVSAARTFEYRPPLQTKRAVVSYNGTDLVYEGLFDECPVGLTANGGDWGTREFLTFYNNDPATLLVDTVPWGWNGSYGLLGGSGPAGVTAGYASKRFCWAVFTLGEPQERRLSGDQTLPDFVTGFSSITPIGGGMNLTGRIAAKMRYLALSFPGTVDAAGVSSYRSFLVRYDEASAIVDGGSQVTTGSFDSIQVHEDHTATAAWQGITTTDRRFEVRPYRIDGVIAGTLPTDPPAVCGTIQSPGYYSRIDLDYLQRHTVTTDKGTGAVTTTDVASVHSVALMTFSVMNGSSFPLLPVLPGNGVMCPDVNSGTYRAD